jgi:hypothetical protein
MAEVIGVSRVWYAKLESDAGLRASSRLLNRLARALALSDADRETLFKIALPELSSSDSSATDEDLATGFEPLRAATKRLQNATGQFEVLQIAAETIAQLFGSAAVVGAFQQLEAWRWSFPVMIAPTQMSMPLSDIRAKLQDAFVTELRHTGTRAGSHHDQASEPHFERAGLLPANFIYKHVKSREGRAATMFALYPTRDRAFTELDHLSFGLVADVASLALSMSAISSERLPRP